jgi:hypothetical protein
MNILLKRDVITTDYTLGQVSIDGVFFCYSLEDPIREQIGPDGYFWRRHMKIPGKTAIPSGRYPVIAWQSPRFGRLLPMIQNVPDFVGILMHAGNDVDDTEGCPLLGEKRDINGGRVWDCAVVVREMTRRVREAGAGKCWIEITNP